MFENPARLAVMEYAVERSDLWLARYLAGQALPGSYGPFCLSDDEAGIMTTIYAWQLPTTNLALMLHMPALGAIQQAIWYIPASLKRDDLLRRMRPDLFRVMDPKEWGNAVHHLDRLLAYTANASQLADREGYVIPASITRRSGGNTHADVPFM